MRKNIEAVSPFDRQILDEVNDLRKKGTADKRPRELGEHRGLFYNEQYFHEGFVVGFNPLLDQPEGEIGAAISASSLAWITFKSVHRSSRWRNIPKKVSEELSIRFCSPPVHKEETIPRINHSMSLDYQFGVCEFSLESNVMNSDTIARKTPGFIFDVLKSIRRAAEMNDSLPAVQ